MPYGDVFIANSTGRRMEFADSFIVDDLHEKLKNKAWACAP